MKSTPYKEINIIVKQRKQKLALTSWSNKMFFLGNVQLDFKTFLNRTIKWRGVSDTMYS